MIIYSNDSIFNSSAQILVNPVNTVGVMGKGLALEFKKRYPEMFEAYHSFNKVHGLIIGKLFVYYHNDSRKTIINFPTKKNWSKPFKLEYIEAGLKEFITYKDFDSVAFPKLGCGRGGLNWEKEVEPLMVKYLSELSMEVILHI